jgi:hypothetical protein
MGRHLQETEGVSVGQKEEAFMIIKALHRTAIPLRSIAAGELWR